MVMLLSTETKTFTQDQNSHQSFWQIKLNKLLLALVKYELKNNRTLLSTPNGCLVCGPGYLQIKDAGRSSHYIIMIQYVQNIC